MSKDEMPYEGHEKHLCYLHGEGLLKDNIEEWKKKVSNGLYFCDGCGRVAKSSENLCDQQKLSRQFEKTGFMQPNYAFEIA